MSAQTEKWLFALLPNAISALVIIVAFLVQVESFKATMTLQMDYLQDEVKELRGELHKASDDRYRRRDANADWTAFRREYDSHNSQHRKWREEIDERMVLLEKRAFFKQG